MSRLKRGNLLFYHCQNQKWGAPAHSGLCLKVSRWEYEKQCGYRRYKVDREYWASRLAVDIEIIVWESKQHIFNHHWGYTDIAGGQVRGESKSALALIDLIISKTKKVRESHGKFRLIDLRFYTHFLPKSPRALGGLWAWTWASLASGCLKPAFGLGQAWALAQACTSLDASRWLANSCNCSSALSQAAINKWLDQVIEAKAEWSHVRPGQAEPSKHYMRMPNKVDLLGYPCLVFGWEDMN